MTKNARIFALIVAAGTGSRAGGDVPKQYARIGGKALLRYAIEALARHPDIAGVQVVIHPGHAAYYAEAVGLGHLSPRERSDLPNRLLRRLATNPGEGAEQQADSRPHPDFLSAASQTLGNPTSPAGRGALASLFGAKLLPPIHGGAERTDSVRAGLAALAPYAPDYVLIHDAARPFLSQHMITKIIAALAPETGVVPAIAVADTVRWLNGKTWVEVSRDGLLRVQTPQAFAYKKLQEVTCGQWPVASASSLVTGHRSLATPTDEAAVWLAAGHELRYVQGDEDLRKVTTEADIAWASARANASRRIAVGMGFDVHALVPSGEAGLICLGGVEIKHSHKLHGHSDGDVVLHAVVDALLGSISAGDIGSHFPPTDMRWKGANSAIFIEEARAQVAAAGGDIQHLDITIIGERPKIAPHRDAMRESIASMLGLPVARVSVKATTTEKLGFTGREEGIAVQAVATISLPMEDI